MQIMKIHNDLVKTKCVVIDRSIDRSITDWAKMIIIKKKRVFSSFISQTPGSKHS